MRPKFNFYVPPFSRRVVVWVADSRGDYDVLSAYIDTIADERVKREDSIAFVVPAKGDVHCVFSSTPTANLVCHESSHVAMRVLEMAGCEDDKVDEEVRTYVQEWVFDVIWKRLNQCIYRDVGLGEWKSDCGVSVCEDGKLSDKFCSKCGGRVKIGK